MKESTILNWIKGDEGNGVPETTKSNKILEIRNRKFQENNENLTYFLTSLPNVESHYCRSSSQKLYIEPLWPSTNCLYNFYKTRHCSEHNIDPVSKTTFFTLFHKLNLSIYTLKKDLCDVCAARETNNLSDEEYQKHQEVKKEARAEKKRDKASTNDFVFTMDLLTECFALFEVNC